MHSRDSKALEDTEEDNQETKGRQMLKPNCLLIFIDLTFNSLYSLRQPKLDLKHRTSLFTYISNIKPLGIDIFNGLSFA